MTEQPRERAVPCAHCRDATWNTDAVCDRCAELSASQGQSAA